MNHPIPTLTLAFIALSAGLHASARAEAASTTSDVEALQRRAALSIREHDVLLKLCGVEIEQARAVGANADTTARLLDVEKQLVAHRDLLIEALVAIDGALADGEVTSLEAVERPWAKAFEALQARVEALDRAASTSMNVDVTGQTIDDAISDGKDADSEISDAVAEAMAALARAAAARSAGLSSKHDDTDGDDLKG